MGHVDGGRLLKFWQRCERIVSRIVGSCNVPVIDRSWHKTKTNFEGSVQSVAKPSSRLACLQVNDRAARRTAASGELILGDPHRQPALPYEVPNPSVMRDTLTSVAAQCARYCTRVGIGMNVQFAADVQQQRPLVQLQARVSGQSRRSL